MCRFQEKFQIFGAKRTHVRRTRTVWGVTSLRRLAGNMAFQLPRYTHPSNLFKDTFLGFGSCILMGFLLYLCTLPLCNLIVVGVLSLCCWYWLWHSSSMLVLPFITLIILPCFTFFLFLPLWFLVFHALLGYDVWFEVFGYLSPFFLKKNFVLECNHVENVIWVEF